MVTIPKPTVVGLGTFGLKAFGRNLIFIFATELSAAFIATAVGKPFEQVKEERQEIIDEIIRETFGRASKRIKKIGRGIEEADFSKFPDIAFPEGRAEIARGREQARRSRIRRGSEDLSRTIFG